MSRGRRIARLAVGVLLIAAVLSAVLARDWLDRSVAFARLVPIVPFNLLNLLRGAGMQNIYVLRGGMET